MTQTFIWDIPRLQTKGVDAIFCKKGNDNEVVGSAVTSGLPDRGSLKPNSVLPEQTYQERLQWDSRTLQISCKQASAKQAALCGCCAPQFHFSGGEKLRQNCRNSQVTHKWKKIQRISILKKKTTDLVLSFIIERVKRKTFLWLLKWSSIQPFALAFKGRIIPDNG